jgi:hypothetical protein
MQKTENEFYNLKIVVKRTWETREKLEKQCKKLQIQKEEEKLHKKEKLQKI